MNYILQEVGNHFMLARGGGGGSSSSGGGGHSSGGGFSSSSSHSSSSSYGGSGGSLSGWGFWVLFLSFGIPILVIILIIWLGKSKLKGGLMSSPPAGFIDPEKDANATAEQKAAAAEAKKVFLDFQTAWSKFDLKKMEAITSPEYYKKMVLELNVLKNYKRQNLMENVQILGTYLGPNTDQSVTVFFQASSDDKLLDTRDDSIVFTDSSAFSEIWTFVRSGKKLVLDKISQTTEDASKFDAGIAQFASDNGFYYDPDFGWLMMPSRGAIFGPAGFGNADLNNHVIGYYGKGQKAKIVEFYSYEPKAGVGLEPITVAQAILPRSYNDILVTEKSWYNFKPKGKGLNKIETESVEFDKKFAVWAADQDQATSFELLATNFMERIYALDFEINIEVVDNVLYLYSPSKDIKYADMLEVLSWAFDEMKM
jgi:hypothetical protein